MKKLNLRQRLTAHLVGLRVRRGLSQQATADAAGVHIRHYQKLEAGEVNATLRTLTRLGAAFGVDPAELVR